MCTELRVDNIHCAGCVGSIDRALKKIDGVRKVHADVKRNRVMVEHDAAVAASRLAEFLREIGFEAAPVEK